MWHVYSEREDHIYYLSLYLNSNALSKYYPVSPLSDLSENTAGLQGNFQGPLRSLRHVQGKSVFTTTTVYQKRVTWHDLQSTLGNCLSKQVYINTKSHQCKFTKCTVGRE